ncbi:Hypothetical predicted protein [Paramuricea clavata]|uniref:Uncharacterized protein n=1 Tax=Paramuricea clavata TaxID=317549 RepID=A0A6S7GTU2_PARCT|nr:Hypothetical predicted protein [Paramuricea clavata]
MAAGFKREQAQQMHDIVRLGRARIEDINHCQIVAQKLNAKARPRMAPKMRRHDDGNQLQKGNGHARREKKPGAVRHRAPKPQEPDASDETTRSGNWDTAGERKKLGHSVPLLEKRQPPL